MGSLTTTQSEEGVSPEEKQKRVEEAVEAIISSCRLAGVDYFSLDKPVQIAMTNIYQVAIQKFYEAAIQKFHKEFYDN